MRRSLLVAMLAAAMVMTMAGSAFAGEINGKGESTPIRGDAHNSICAFSGLQDGDGPGDPISGPGHVQTPHGEPDYDLYFPPGVASICQWANNGAWHSQRPPEPPLFPGE
ncbi:MAG: hypothetical protein P1T08_05665 [Acidimicrobiia bacterium]|nr:hypothetical protein [Acidimicrobiia bacterium]